MRNMEISGEFVGMFVSVFSLIQFFLMGVMIKLLKDMRTSGWSIEFNATAAAEAAETAALKGGYTERRIMAYCFAGQFNNWELVRQIMSLFF